MEIAVSVIGTAVPAASDRNYAPQILGGIIPSVVDEAEDAPPPFRRRVAAWVSDTLPEVAGGTLLGIGAALLL